MNKPATPTTVPIEGNVRPLVERLRECLPTVADGPDANVWCCVRGDDLRQAVTALEAIHDALNDCDVLAAVEPPVYDALLLRRHIPMPSHTAIYEACTCGRHRPGSLTAGWVCPQHGQQW